MREDLSAPQIAVQSSHACIEATSAFNLGNLAEHPSVIICGIKNETKLNQVRKFLIDNGIRHVHFYEPDIDDELTALATEPLHGDRRNLFRKFQLLRPKTAAPVPDASATRYALKLPNGSYYQWRGECARNETWRLEDAHLSNDPHFMMSGEVVKVEVTYTEKGGVK